MYVFQVQNTVIAERISDRQVIMQQVRHYSWVFVCMYVCTYVYMSAKNSGLLIVGSVKHNCTAVYALHRVCHPYYHKLTVTYEKRVVSIDLTYKYCRIDRHHYNPKPSPETTKYVSSP